jgi:hypothetical protein
MSNILRLPVGTERLWPTELAPTFRAELIGAGMPIATVNWILADFERRFFAAFRDAQFEMSISDAPVVEQVLRRIREMQNQQILGAVREMLKLQPNPDSKLGP